MILITTILVSFSAKAQTSNAILGKWQDIEHPEKQVQITSQSDSFIGKFINSSKSYENGKTVLKDLVWSEASKSYKGILIEPNNGSEYEIEIKMIGTDQFRFSVGNLIFSKTFNFKRITQ